MKADFSGYATKAGLRCSDGRTIMPDAFKHQDKVRVPLVWQHGHSDPENVLGHAILENRKDGVYAYGFFNKSAKAKHAAELVEHKDINMMSIWANQLVEKAKQVFHGVIKEVSLVLAGANPGALIDNVTIRHADGETTTLEDEVIIFTGLAFGHADDDGETDKTKTTTDDDDDDEEDETVKDIYDSMTPKQQDVVNYMVGQALVKATGSTEHSDTTTKKGSEMATIAHNVFEDKKDKDKTPVHVLSHDDVKGIVESAMKGGSLREAVESYALQHGIENIEILFPEAKAMTTTPEFDKRRTEWVTSVLGAAHKTPFSRIKTLTADLTFEEARAKGYIKGNLKKEEFFAVSRRVTTPQTVYKKQKLDRDDMIDITDFDVVAWLKGEMRLMLEEELAGAILIGDGRAVDDEDKIQETNIRPIAKDDSLFTVQINVDLNDPDSSVEEILDAIILNRQYYKGSGNPTMFTTETFIAQVLLLRDNDRRKLYRSVEEFATEMRVSKVVAVEILDRDPTVQCILVNMQDYNIGADKGGEVNLFDDFDIDYNQYKYLIETRASGALTKIRSAMVLRAVEAGNVAETASAPAWDAATYTVTIPVEANVEYRNYDTGAVLADGAAIVLAAGEVLTVAAFAEDGYYLTNTKTRWSYMRPSGT